MRTIRRIEIDTDHPNAETIIAVEAAVIADALDKRGVQFSVIVTDSMGTPLEVHGEAFSHESEEGGCPFCGSDDVRTYVADPRNSYCGNCNGKWGNE